MYTVNTMHNILIRSYSYVAIMMYNSNYYMSVWAKLFLCLWNFSEFLRWPCQGTILIGRSNLFLSERLSQDPLERFFFGTQRQKDHTHETPNAKKFYQNTQALRVINSFCVHPVKENCTQRKNHLNIEEESALLHRCKRCMDIFFCAYSFLCFWFIINFLH